MVLFLKKKTLHWYCLGEFLMKKKTRLKKTGQPTHPSQSLRIRIFVLQFSVGNFQRPNVRKLRGHSVWLPQSFALQKHCNFCIFIYYPLPQNFHYKNTEIMFSYSNYCNLCFIFFSELSNLCVEKSNWRM